MTSIDVSSGGATPITRIFTIKRRDGRSQKLEFLCFTAYTTQREAKESAKLNKAAGIRVRTVPAKNKRLYFVFLNGEM